MKYKGFLTYIVMIMSISCILITITGSLLRGFQIQLMGVDDYYPIKNYKLDLGENDSRFSGSQHFSSLQASLSNQ